MFQFRVGSIPVQVQSSHLLTAFVMGFLFTEGKRPASGLQWALHISLWVLIIFISVLVHELGHAHVSKLFGYSPSITLLAFGGATQPNARHPLPWHHDVLLTLAGPFYGFLLAAVCWGVYLAGNSLAWASSAWKWAASANVVWSILNLIPVMPLDGGRITQAILMRLLGRRGFYGAHTLGLLVAIAVATFGAVNQLLILAIMFASYGFQSFALMRAASRGQLALADSPSPEVEMAMAQAEQLTARGYFEKASATLAPLLTHDVPQPHPSRLHKFLGLLELKQGRGSKAMEHFQKVQALKVEPELWAAAYSLCGEDEKALPRWAEAHEHTPNATLLHEWAGALIRQGRLDEAFSLSQVQPDMALTCAERVLFLRGEFLLAGQLAERGLNFSATPERAYEAACAFARAGEVTHALRLLEKAATLGFRDVQHAATDTDLVALHALPEFQAWLQSLGKKNKSMTKR